MDLDVADGPPFLAGATVTAEDQQARQATHRQDAQHPSMYPHDGLLVNLETTLTC